ncbi:MAG TPA: adenylate/guanylate cyclase domain-containing protein [Candidatus Limnocylindrales bacterium]|nr:adenylate/guanylate cyclase domain-containing protein [Candidatus Limnocylindrales bacterium]
MAPLPEQRSLPEGTVTFLFSDLEGSTNILERYGSAAGAALLRHHEIYEELVDRNRGVIFETVGDAVYAAFASPADAVAAALDAHHALAAEPWTEIGGRLACRISLHTGVVERRGSRYFGAPLFRAARLQALAYGEQTVVSAATAALVRGDLPAGAVLIDRGVHRLKDLHEPEHVYELQHPDLRTEFPPLKSLDARPHNLPIQLSSFVGRDDELQAIGALVRDHRLVTLLGPGGIGKTRLALQATADAIDQFKDGVWFVDLAPTVGADAIPDAIAAVLRVPQRADQPVIQTLREHVRARKLLLVLDNLEQLLPGAASVVAELMSGAADLHIVTTSRAPLRIRGETEFSVPPLGAGDVSTTDRQLPGAVALFLARAREIRPDFAITAETGPLVAAICNRLDGLPLAIELAASRLRIFPLVTLAERLENRLPVLVGGARDLPERQQTLRATIAWSDELLSEPDRELFHRLGAFAGSFGFDGATAVAEPGADVEAGITGLLEQSLIRPLDARDEPRFAMLETVREFAVDALGLQARVVVMDRLAEYICSLAARSADDLVGHRQAATLRLMDAELPNIRATLEWLLARRDGARLPALVADLARYWAMRGLARETRRWLAAVEPFVTDPESNVRARLYRAASMGAEPGKDARRTKEVLERAVAIHRARGEARDLARSLLALSLIGNLLSDFDLTARTSSEAVALARETGDVRTEGAAEGNMAQAQFKRGQIDAAEAGFRQSNALLERAGDNHGVAQGKASLALIARTRGDLAAAAKLHEDSAAEFAEMGDPVMEVMERLNLAMARSLLGDSQQALAGVVRALALMRRSVDDALMLVGLLSIGASVLHGAGDVLGAARFWAVSAALAEARSLPIDPADRDETTFAQVRAELGTAYAVIEAQAAGTSLEEATDELESRLRRLVQDGEPHV